MVVTHCSSDKRYFLLPIVDEGGCAESLVRNNYDGISRKKENISSSESYAYRELHTLPLAPV